MFDDKPQTAPAGDAVRVCKACDTEKPIGEFYRDRQWHQTRCKPCTKAKKKLWRKENPGRHAAVQAAFVKRNPERWVAIVRRYQEKKAKSDAQ